MVFSILVEVTIPVSSCRTPRACAACCAAAAVVSFAITLSSIRFRAATSSPARSRAWLPAISVALPIARSRAGKAGGKSARPTRLAALRARPCSFHGIFQCVPPHVRPLQVLRQRNELRQDGQFLRSELHGFGSRRQNN